MSRDSKYQIWSEDSGRWLDAWSIESDEEMNRLNKIAGRELYRVRP